MNNAATRMIVKSLSVIRNEAVRFFACVFFVFIFILLSNVYFAKHAEIFGSVCLGKYAFACPPPGSGECRSPFECSVMFFRINSGQNIAVLNYPFLPVLISGSFFSWRSELLLRRSRGRNRQRRTMLYRYHRLQEGRNLLY